MTYYELEHEIDCTDGVLVKVRDEYGDEHLIGLWGEDDEWDDIDDEFESEEEWW